MRIAEHYYYFVQLCSHMYMNILQNIMYVGYDNVSSLSSLSSTIRDLGVILDTELSFSPHINLLVNRCFYQLRRIKSCVKSLPADAAKSVVNSFVISRIDYCNCLLAGCHKYQLDRLQSVMNTAARLILGLRKYDVYISSCVCWRLKRSTVWRHRT